jgi:hypothetical protein
MRGTSRNLVTLGGGEVWRTEVKPQSELNEEVQKNRVKDMVSQGRLQFVIETPWVRKTAVKVEYHVGAGSWFGVVDVM